MTPFSFDVDPNVRFWGWKKTNNLAFEKGRKKGCYEFRLEKHHYRAKDGNGGVRTKYFSSKLKNILDLDVSSQKKGRTCRTNFVCFFQFGIFSLFFVPKRLDSRYFSIRTMSELYLQNCKSYSRETHSIELWLPFTQFWGLSLKSWLDNNNFLWFRPLFAFKIASHYKDVDTQYWMKGMKCAVIGNCGMKSCETSIKIDKLTSSSPPRSKLFPLLTAFDTVSGAYRSFSRLKSPNQIIQWNFCWAENKDASKRIDKEKKLRLLFVSSPSSSQPEYTV